jgi:hypothetical protein
MKNVAVSTNMGSWPSRAKVQLIEPADRAERCRRAKNVQAGLKVEAQSVVDWARAKGFDSREDLAAIPLVRQTLLALSQASSEYAAAQGRRARRRRRRSTRRSRPQVLAA